MRSLIFVAIVAAGCAGCFYIGQETFEDIVRIPPARWSSRDCLTLILASMAHNLHDEERNLEVIATPFYPSVILAVNQLRKTEQHWTDDEARYHLDELMRGGAGLYVDWKDGRFVNARGNYFRNQTDIDSLLFVISMRNKTYPCAVPMTVVYGTLDGQSYNYGMVPLLGLNDWPCYTPCIADIDRRVFLVNEDGDTLRPRFIAGRRNEVVINQETLFAMFHFRAGGKHFLQDQSSCRLVISDFDTPMSFPMATARMR
jgi:hypothetical protein